MNERFGNVQFDYNNQAKYLQMISNQDQNYSILNKPNTNMLMPSNNSNFLIENLTSSMQNTSINNFGLDFPNNTNRSMELYASSNNKYQQNIRQQTSNIDRSNLINRFSNLPNNGTKYNNHLVGSDKRMFSNNINLGSMHPMHMNLNSNNPNNNNNNNNVNQLILMDSPSMIHKQIEPELLISKKDIQRNTSKNASSTMFFTPSNLKLVSQQQRDNELENPKWIVFPPVLQSAAQLRQGKQHLVNNKSVENAITIDEELKKILVDRISACLVCVNGKSSPKLPDTVLQYTDITPIESTYEIRKSKTFNRPSICYKAFDTETEQFVLLRRFPSLVIQSAKDIQLQEKYLKIKHPGLISIIHVFVTDAFKDNSTVFIMNYCPCSVTALQAHVSDVGKLIGFASPFNVTQQARPYSSSKSDFSSDPIEMTFSKIKTYARQKLISTDRTLCDIISEAAEPIQPKDCQGFFNKTASNIVNAAAEASDLNMLSEEKSWCYLIQLINIIRYVHNTLGMNCKIIDPSKILIQYPDRVRLNCFGLIDFFSDDNNMLISSIEDTNDMIVQQARDLETLGQFMLCIICGTTIAIQDNDSSIACDLLQRFYSSNLKSTVMKLIRNEYHSINEVATNTFAECYNHVTNMYIHIDYLEFNLMKELECGRLFRLVCKLATICERNELGMDSNWSDYGANYQLKLFRDFVFHQVDSNGAPYLDLAHVVTCLNKLDAGSNENVCLISRDGLNMFCVTFADLKQVLDDSFEQLLLTNKKESNLADAFQVNSVIN